MDPRQSKVVNIMKLKYKIKKLEVHADERGWLVNLFKSNELEKPVKQLHISSKNKQPKRGIVVEIRH